MGEWYLVRVFRTTLEHIDEGWDALDADHRRRWFATMLIGLAMLLVLTLALVFIGRMLDERGLLSWERGFLARLARSPVPFGWAIWLESPGNGIILWPIVMAAAGIAAWRRRPLLAISFLAGFALLDAAVVMGWTIWKRPRPEVIAGGIASAGESFSAFPSGHVSQTIVAYGLLVALWVEQTRRRSERFFAWMFLAFIASMVAYGRMRLGAHWPSDVVAGAIVGTFWLMVLMRALRGSVVDS